MRHLHPTSTQHQPRNMAAVASMITARPVLSVQKASKASFSGSVRALKATRSVSVARSAFVVTAERKLWKPDSEPPAHLDGTMPGDYGFDPLGLGQDPERLKWYQGAELMNGRWAMMAVAGILFTSALGFSDGKWFLSGAKETEIPTLALMTRQGPLDNLSAHIGDALNNNFITSIANIQ